MAENANATARPLVVGANHRSSSLGLRDRLFVEDAEVPAFLERLRHSGVDEAVVLSTCDRVEVQAVDADAEAASQRILEALAGHAGMEARELTDETYTLFDGDAVNHVFSVAASLDSLVVGEPQVLGQVKAGHRLARDNKMVQGGLEAVLQAAYGAAKRVRSETAIGEGPVSIAAVALDLARGVHGDPSRVSGLLFGVGDMGVLIAEQFASAGLNRLAVHHPVRQRAEPVARNLGCHVVETERVAEALADADVVICALGRRQHALSADHVRNALTKRRRRPQFIIDTGVPGDVEPAVNRLDEAFVYDLADLDRIAAEGRGAREAAAEAARRIIDEESRRFHHGQAQRAAVPALTALRGHVEDLRDDALAEAGGDAEKATRLLAGRLLHGPSEVLRTWGAEDPVRLAEAEELLREMFELTDLANEENET